MGIVDLRALEQAPVKSDPFDHVLVRDFVPKSEMAGIISDYPEITHPGSFPLGSLNPGAQVRRLIEALGGAEFRTAVERKLDIDLDGAPAVFTLRGRCARTDGKIHTDSKKKLVSVLLYLNSDWADDGGRLRLLRNGEDIESTAVEIPPEFGTLLIFRRSDQSWHGHLPYAGPRKVLQMNWMRGSGVAGWEQFRHGVTALLKRARPAA